MTESSKSKEIWHKNRILAPEYDFEKKKCIEVLQKSREGNDNRRWNNHHWKFWKQIFSEEKGFSEGSMWINQQDWEEELETALKKSHKWEWAGIGKIPNFWLHALSNGHSKLASLLSDIFEITEKAPKWLPKGVTYLSLKTADTKNPKN